MAEAVESDLRGSPKVGHYRVHFHPFRDRESRRIAGADLPYRVRSARRPVEVASR